MKGRSKGSHPEGWNRQNAVGSAFFPAPRRWCRNFRDGIGRPEEWRIIEVSPEGKDGFSTPTSLNGSTPIWVRQPIVNVGKKSDGRV